MNGRVKITEELRNAIISAVEKAGSQNELSRRCGVSQKNLSNYVSGMTNFMNYTTLEKLTPFLKSEIGNMLPEISLRDREMFSFADIVRKVMASTELDEHAKVEVVRLFNSEDTPLSR